MSTPDPFVASQIRREAAASVSLDHDDRIQTRSDGGLMDASDGRNVIALQRRREIEGALEELLDDSLVHGVDYTAGEVLRWFLAGGWRPPAREITTAADLDALPYGSIVLPQHCDPFKRKTLPEGLRWTAEGFPDGLASEQLLRHYSALGCPIAVLHTPTEEAPDV